MENVITKNEAGGVAYQLDSAQALALYANTGCLSDTFYTSKELQIKTIIDLCEKTDPELVGKIAIYSRKNGFMKEVPALLVTCLAKKCADLKNTNQFGKISDIFGKTFNEVIDNGKMLRKFIKHLNSGITGRKSLGHLPRKLVNNWFDSRTEKEIFLQSIGSDPSFSSILKLSHPKPLNDKRQALYQWLTKRKYNKTDLPDIIQHFEEFKKGESKEVPKIPVEMLTALNLKESDWIQIALNCSWSWLRQNLNTLNRHGVFKHAEITKYVVEKLTNRDNVKKSNVFPYQIFTTYVNTHDIPYVVRDALQDVMEISTENVPEIDGKGYILLDVSGSMNYPVTGNGPAASKMKYVDVASLLSCCILRKNPHSQVIPFADKVKIVDLNPRDTVISNSQKLSSMSRGGTNCSAPLSYLNEKNVDVDWVFLISDNQSWLGLSKLETPFISEWKKLKKNNKDAKLVCLDICPYETSQVCKSPEIFNIGGFSDSVFTVVDNFFKNKLTPNYWLDVIEKITLGDKINDDTIA